MYKQLRTPNLDPVVYQGGEALNDWYGWCYAVAWTAFGGQIRNPTAWDGWQATAYKHQDSNLPSGVYVPIWFSGYGGAGHVAIYKDGEVWSSPWRHKPYMDTLSSIAQVEQYYGVTYVGWSEDIGGVRVVEEVSAQAQGGDMPIPDQDNYYWRYGQKLGLQVRGRELSREEFRTYLVGQTDLRAVEILSDDAEADQALHAQQVGQVAVRDNWQGQIYDLQDKLKAAEAALATEQGKPAKVVETTVYTEDTATKQNVNAILVMVTAIFDYFKGSFKSFAKFIKRG